MIPFFFLCFHSIFSSFLLWLPSFLPLLSYLPCFLCSYFFISSLAYFNPYFLSSLLTYILRTFFLSLHSFFFLYSIIFFFDSLLCYRSYISSFLPSFLPSFFNPSCSAFYLSSPIFIPMTFYLVLLFVLLHFLLHLLPLLTLSFPFLCPPYFCSYFRDFILCNISYMHSFDLSYLSSFSLHDNVTNILNIFLLFFFTLNYSKSWTMILRAFVE